MKGESAKLVKGVEAAEQSTVSSVSRELPSKIFGFWEARGLVDKIRSNRLSRVIRVVRYQIA